MLKSAKKNYSSTLITDISSTKKHISTLINQGYVSSHPICGSEQSGPTTANADVFDSARVVVVGHDVERVKNFWQSLAALYLRWMLKLMISFLDILATCHT